MPPSYFSRLGQTAQNGFKSSIVGQELGLQDCAEALIEQGKIVFGKYRSFHLLSHSTLTDLDSFLQPTSAFSASFDSLVNQRKKLTVVGALSRTFSIPSVSGPAYQVFGYHIDRLLSEPNNSVKQKIAMAATGPKSVFHDCLVDNLILKRSCHTVPKNPASTVHCKKGFHSCGTVSMSIKNHERPNHAPLYAYFMYNVMKSKYNMELYSWSAWKDFRSSSSTSQCAETAPSKSSDSSLQEDQGSGSTESSSQKVSADRILKLNSGSFYLPHPDKEESGGEDAHFICVEEHAVGVADGVGGWADFGIDAGKYARELMSNSASAIQEEPKGYIDPARVLEKAHSSTKAKGSSTACIIALTNQGLHAINLGDSGFIVVRDGCTVFRSPAQQHDFNFTYQLESGPDGDLPSSGQIFTIPVAPGDVIIAGTDGLFDNLYNSEVTAIVVHAKREGLGPHVTAQKIAALARQRAQDRNRQTPFSTAAQDAGFRYYGGKLDDITVVVSYITKSNNENDSSPSVNNSC